MTKTILRLTTISLVSTSTLSAEWTLRTNGPEAAASFSLAYGNGVFVSPESSSVDGQLTLYVSSDGESWSLTTIDEDIFIDSLQFLNGQFFLTAQGGGSAYLFSSSGGSDWAGLLTGRIAFPVAAKMDYGDGRYVIAGGGAGNRNIAFSTDPEDWTKVQASTSFSYFDALAYGDGVWVAMNSDPGIFYSTDGGENWQSTTVPSTDEDYQIADLSYGNGIFLATAGYNTADDDASLILTSTDGINWDIRKTALHSLGNVYFADGQFGIVGNLESGLTYPPVVVFTTDGVDLTQEPLPFPDDQQGRGITYGGGLWMVTSSNAEFATKGTFTGGTADDVWHGYPVEDGWANTHSWLGWVEVSEDPFIWVPGLDQYLHIPNDSGWVYVPQGGG